MSRHARHIFLVGFMATGKTTVGRLVAEKLALPFFDLDDAIEERAGLAIADLFATHGEAHFRALEAQVLAEVAAGAPAVIATGGGAACHGDNLVRMRKSGFVVALTAPLEMLRERVTEPARRPLLMRPESEVRALYHRRVPYYRQAHVCVRTEEGDAESVARTIVRLVDGAVQMSQEALSHASFVALAERSYPIIVAPGCLHDLGALARSALSPWTTRIGIIADSHVAPLYGAAAQAALRRVGLEASLHVTPAGEESKSFAELERLTEALVEAGLDRRSAIVALGGGVVGDLAGFVAASLYRGIDFIQAPTTVLAMVDSAIGGKTGINIAAGKNLVGAFWQPRMVLADPAVLATLPVRERRAAFGELIKYALLDSEDLYAEIDSLAPTLGGESTELPPQDRLTDVIRRCAGIKSWIVTRDEREQTGERALLNLGHTLGHAIEAAAGYGELLHGEAVALGLVAACRVSARLGLCSSELEERVVTSIRRAGLDANVDVWLREDVVARIAVDKKRQGHKIGFITVAAIGSTAVTEIAFEELAKLLRG